MHVECQIYSTVFYPSSNIMHFHYDTRVWKWKTWFSVKKWEFHFCLFMLKHAWYHSICKKNYIDVLLDYWWLNWIRLLLVSLCFWQVSKGILQKSFLHDILEAGCTLGITVKDQYPHLSITTLISFSHKSCEKIMKEIISRFA